MFGVVRRNPQFRRLWLSQVVSQAGDWLNRMAVLDLIGELSGGGAQGALGLLFGLELVLRLGPLGLFTPLAGTVADRLPRRLLMVSSDVLRAVVVVGLLAVDDPGDLPLLYGLIFALMSLSIFFDAARLASVPNTVAPHELLEANTLMAATWSTMLALGAFLGGLILSWIGLQGVFLLDAATFLGSALLLRRLKLPRPPKHTAAFRWGDVLLLADMRAALAHLRALGLVPILLVKTFWGMAGGFLVLLSVLGTERYQLASRGLAIGFLYAARGVGTGLGPLLARRLSGTGDRALARSVVIGFGVAAAGYACVPLAGNLAVACLCVTVAHMGGSTIWVSSTVFWQRRVADAYRGRVHSLDFLGLTLSFGLWGMGIGMLYDASGSIDVCLWTAAAAALVAGLAWRLLARGLTLRD